MVNYWRSIRYVLIAVPAIEGSIFQVSVTRGERKMIEINTFAVLIMVTSFRFPMRLSMSEVSDIIRATQPLLLLCFRRDKGE